MRARRAAGRGCGGVRCAGPNWRRRGSGHEACCSVGSAPVSGRCSGVALGSPAGLSQGRRCRTPARWLATHGAAISVVVWAVFAGPSVPQSVTARWVCAGCPRCGAGGDVASLLLGAPLHRGGRLAVCVPRPRAGRRPRIDGMVAAAACCDGREGAAAALRLARG